LQEKENGRRGGLTKQGCTITACNKKGEVVGLSETISDACAALGGNFEIDGEMFADHFKAYDIFSLNGKNLRNMPYLVRFELLCGLLTNSKVITPTKTAYTTKEKVALFDWLKKNNREGVVFKRKQSLLRVGKGHGEHFKCKFWVMATVQITKINKQRSVGVSMLNDKQELEFVGNVTVKHNQDFKAMKVGQLWEVEYLYIIAKGGSLYQPELLFERDDQDQPDLVSSLKISNQSEEE